MKLYYHNDINFGDALNPILLNKLLPNFFNDDITTTFVGIGSILGVYQPRKEVKNIIVFTSGYAYGKYKPWPNTNTQYLAVRGKLTAKKVGIDEKLAISDGGILTNILTDNLNLHVQKQYKFSYMPHHYSIDKYDNYEEICNQIGLNFINPVVSKANSIINIADAISKTEILLTEALHGAIVAESYRVPYIPIKCYRHINTFKWNDFASSLNINYKLNKVERLYSREFFQSKMKEKFSFNEHTSDTLLNSLKKMNFFNENKFKEDVSILMKKQEYYLSDDNIINEKKEKLYQIIDKLKKTN